MVTPCVWLLAAAAYWYTATLIAGHLAELLDETPLDW